MPFRRAGFVLTPPSLPIFLISAVLALLAILARFGVLDLAVLTSSRAFLLLLAAYVVLAVGVLLRQL